MLPVRIAGILEFVASQDSSKHAALMAVVEDEERRALKSTALRPDAEAVLRTLKERGNVSMSSTGKGKRRAGAATICCQCALIVHFELVIVAICD